MAYKKLKNKNMLRGLAIVLSGMMTFSLAGCSAGTSSDTGSVAAVETEGTGDSSVLTSEDATANADDGQEALTAAGITDDLTVNYIDSAEQFTEKDSDPSYEEDDAETIELADGASKSSSSKKVSILENTVTITEEGTYVISGSLSNGQLVVDADGAKVQLVLSSVSITNESSAAIYIKNADKVFITLADDTENVVATTGEYVAIDDNNIDGTIFSKSNITINGSGSLQVSSTYGHGIVSKDALKITDGTISVSSAESALAGKDSVRISGGTFFLESDTDGIHAEDSDDDTKGYIYISGGYFDITCDSDGIDGVSIVQIDGGEFNIAAGDDGVHCDTSTIINGGDINISSSYEGIEGTSIVVNAGNISVVSSDDGFNAAGGNDSSGFGFGMMDQFNTDGSGSFILINGGTINVDARGDGVDSNGNLYVTGGTTIVNGPSDSANGAIDYQTTGIITGGTFMAIGASGMAMNFGDSSTQCSILTTVSNGSAGDLIELLDSEGNVLVSATAARTYNSIQVSCPDMTSDGTYEIRSGDSSTSIEMGGSIIYGSSSEFGFGGGGFGGNMGGGNMGGGNMGGGNHNSGGGFGHGKGSTSGDSTSDGSATDDGTTDGSASDENPANGGSVTPPDGSDGTIPTLPDGTTPTLPDDFDGTMPDGFDGTMPDGFDGTMPDGFDGTMPDGFDGTVPDGFDGTIPDESDGTVSDSSNEL